MGGEKGQKLKLGTLEAERDWGNARDYVHAIWLMLQKEEPDDYVISTGEAHSVREFLDLAFQRVGLDYHSYVVIDPRLYRPAEIDMLVGNPKKGNKELGWTHTVTFRELVYEMVDGDSNRQQAILL